MWRFYCFVVAPLGGRLTLYDWRAFPPLPLLLLSLISPRCSLQAGLLGLTRRFRLGYVRLRFHNYPRNCRMLQYDLKQILNVLLLGERLIAL